MIMMASKGHFLTQMPQPMQSSSEIQASLEEAETSMQSFPVFCVRVILKGGVTKRGSRVRKGTARKRVSLLLSLFLSLSLSLSDK
jgi:hypothetical protein